MARIATAAVLLAVLLAGLFLLPNFWWSLFLMPAVLVASWEWGGLAGWKTRERGGFCALLLLSCLAVGNMNPGGLPDWLVFGAAGLFWLILAPWLILREWRCMKPVVLACTGWILLFPTWLALVRLQETPAVLLSLMAIVWVSDTFAFIAGKHWGRHKLAPRVSPGKTWEGVAGAVVAVAVYYAVLNWAVMPAHALTTGLSGMAMFLAITVLGIEGDLFESWIKRTAGVKDSGQLLPGHGGVLDRVDALTSSMPVAAFASLTLS